MPADRKWRFLAAGGIAVAVIGTVIAVFSHVVRTDATKARFLGLGIPVRVAHAQVSTLEQVVGAEGEVSPVSTVNLTMPLPGIRVRNVAVDVGSVVRCGDVLAELDDGIVKAALESKKESVAKARTDIEKARQTAQANLDGCDAALQSAKDQLANAETGLKNADLHRQRTRSLYEKKLVAGIELEEAEAEYAKKKAEQAAARQRLTVAENDVRTAAVNNQSMIDAARDAYSDALVAYQKARYDWENRVIRATVDAIVVEKLVNPGETPRIGERMFNLGRIDSVYAVVNVYEENVGNVRIGQESDVVFDAFPNENYVGKVEKIDPNTDPRTRSFKVYIRVPNPDLKLKPGLHGFGKIRNSVKGVCVPSIALINPVGPTEATLFVVENSTARLRKVRIGLVGGGMSEILGGVAAGEDVVTVGQMNLRDGDKVRIGEGDE